MKIQDYCETKKYDCSNCEINKNHESGNCEKLFDAYTLVYNKAIDDFTERLKPIIDKKIKGWTNSDDLRRWCERSIDEISEQLKAGADNGVD